MEEIQKQAKKIVTEYLVEHGHLSMFALTEFIYFGMSKELGKAIIGLENYKKVNPDQIKEIDMRICLSHDIGGILREEKHFLPRSLSYLKYYEDNQKAIY